jgi:hypothetical protein
VLKSRERLLEGVEKYKLNSNDDFFYEKNYFKINNTNLPAAETAKMIVDKFAFPVMDRQSLQN